MTAICPVRQRPGILVALERTGVEVEVEDHAVEPAKRWIDRHRAHVVHRPRVAGDGLAVLLVGVGDFAPLVSASASSGETLKPSIEVELSIELARTWRRSEPIQRAGVLTSSPRVCRSPASSSSRFCRATVIGGVE